MKYFPLLLALGLVSACSGDDEGCVDDEMQCTAEGVLQHCHEGAWEDHEDCAAAGQTCDAEMGHCMDDSGMSM